MSEREGAVSSPVFDVKTPVNAPDVKTPDVQTPSGGGAPSYIEPQPSPQRVVSVPPIHPKVPKRAPIADRRELPNRLLYALGWFMWAGILTQVARLSEAREGALSADLARLYLEVKLLGLGLTAEQALGVPSAPLISHLTRGLDQAITLSPWASPAKLAELLWLLLGLLGVTQGAWRLYQRRDLAWLAGGLFSLCAAPLLMTPHLATWHLPLLTWVGVGLISLWRAPLSWGWSFGVGLLVALGVSAEPLYLCLLPYLIGLQLWPTWVRVSSGVRLSRPLERVARALVSLVGFTLGVAPWCLKGGFASPPLNIEQAPELISAALERLLVGAPYALSAPWGWLSALTLLASLTWMSAHISGVAWTRRGAGLGLFTALSLLLSASLSAVEGAGAGSNASLMSLSALIWVAVHPWSPLGSFTLLSFKPFGKRFVSLALFVALGFTPARRAYEHVMVTTLEETQPSSLMNPTEAPLSAELLSLSAWHQHHRERQVNGALSALWVWGEEAWPLYELTGTLSPLGERPGLIDPLLGDLTFGDERVKALPEALRQAPPALLVLSIKRAEGLPLPLRQLTRDAYRRAPSTDYGWTHKSAFEVYVRRDLKLSPVQRPLPALRKSTQQPQQAQQTQQTQAPKAPSAVPTPEVPSPFSPTSPTSTPQPLSPGLTPPPALGEGAPSLGAPSIPVTKDLPPIPPRFGAGRVKPSEGAEEAGEAGEEAQAGEESSEETADAEGDAEGGSSAKEEPEENFEEEPEENSEEEPAEEDGAQPEPDEGDERE